MCAPAASQPSCMSGQQAADRANTHTHTHEWTDGRTDGRHSGAQTLLQQWAALELLESKPGNVILQKLLQQEADTWQAVLEEVCPSVLVHHACLGPTQRDHAPNPTCPTQRDHACLRPSPSPPSHAAPANAPARRACVHGRELDALS